MYIFTKTPEDQIAFDGMIYDTVKKVIILGGFGALHGRLGPGSAWNEWGK